MVDIAFGALGLKLFERIITNLANDEVLRGKFEENGKSVMDFLQVNLGKVSKRSESEEIFLAINSSNKQDKETLCEIVAVITTLFTTCKIERGAQVGGTLLAEFGDKVYPHIAERELGSMLGEWVPALNDNIKVAYLYHPSTSYFNYKGAIPAIKKAMDDAKRESNS
ncbi:hypothetical protein AB7X05_05320 [Providencia rettgeri]